jgi:formate/nitrite transporter FocA (FNT family)
VQSHATPAERSRSEEEDRQPRTAASDLGPPATDEPEGDSKKSYVTILAQEIREGLDELERPSRGLFLSGLSAGLDVGFSVLALGVLGTLAVGASPLTDGLVRANAYALGFILVVFGRSELFTEHTTIAALPVLDGQASVLQLGRLWGLVYAGNLVGTLFLAIVVATVGPATGSIDPKILQDLGHDLLRGSWWVVLISALLAGWLMGLLSWLVTAGRDTSSQIVFVWLITATIGLAGLHHCILGTAEILAARFSGAEVGLLPFLRFLGLSTAGNAVGGVVFVGVVKYAHASVVRGRFTRLPSPGGTDRDRRSGRDVSPDW